MHMQPHFNRVRQEESCHQLGEVVQRSFVFYFYEHNLALHEP